MSQFQESGFFVMEDGSQSNLVVPRNPNFLPHVIVPKKPWSAYFIYIHDSIKKYREANPDVTHQHALKHFGSKWSKMDETQKHEFDHLVKEDKKRYETQLNDLLTHGYFIMSDGSKSCGHERRIKRKRGHRGQDDQEMEI